MINSPTVLAGLAPPSPVAAETWPRLPRRDLKRPRGLWKARRRPDPATTSSLTQHQLLQTTTGDTKSNSSGRGSDTDHDVEDREMDESSGDGEDDGDHMSQGSGSSKRQRRDSATTGSSTCSSVEMWAVYVGEGGGAVTPPAPTYSGVAPGTNNDAARSALISKMVTTAIAEGASRAKETFEYNDWEEIKETLTQASELFDLDDLSGSIPLLRAVIHECHRFLLRFPDPSVFFSRPPVAHLRREGSRSSDSFVLPDSEERPWHEPKWRRSLTPDSDVGHGQSRHRHRHGHESPTALHAALGTALFLFGNVIAQNSSLAMSREPLTPSPYWRAALDVFNAGDNLPCQTSGNDAPDDTSEHNWRVAIAWGRTLVSLAYEATKHSPPPSPATARPSRPSHPPRYPPRSPLAAISAMYSASLSHTRATPTELLALAADQFARGIFHMPHTLHTASRPQALFTLASEVLAVAERLDDAESRKRWAAWADAVFLQMHMEADVDAWRARIAVARGRCWLSIGSARMDEMEDKLERGEIGVLSSKEAEDARAGLSMAISFFDRAKGSASTESSETALVDMRPWLAEALLSLANLTADQGAREALYARAQAEGGEAVARQLGLRRVRSRSADVRMDESS